MKQAYILRSNKSWECGSE